MATFRAAHRAERTARRLPFGASTRVLIVVVTVLACVVAMSSVAFSYLSSSGTGTGSATTGTLNVPTAVAGVQVTGTSTVDVTWTAPTGPTAPTGYYVLRTPSPSGTAVAACGTSAAAPTASTSCADASVEVGAYTYVVVAVFRTWTSTSAASSVVDVVATTQSITFTSSPVTPTVGGTYLVTATGGASGNPVTFASDTPGVCTISGAATVSFDHAGTCTINADQAGNAQYDAAPQVQQSFTVAKVPQTVTFTSVAPSDAVVGGTGYLPSASGGGSGNPVAFSIDATTAANCSISAGVVTYQHVGSCTVNADQAGDGDYLAGFAQQSYGIGQGAQAITYTSTAPTAAKVNGTSYAVSTTGGGSGNAVTFSSATAPVCTVSGTTVSFVGAGTCTVNANQAGNADYLAASQVQQTFNVTRNDQTITFTSTAPSAATYQGATYNVTATSTSGLGVTLTVDSGSASVCSLSGSTVSFTGVGACVINANQAGNGAFNAAPQVQQSFTVGQASQAITFVALGGKTFGNAPFAISATASSGLTVAFTSATTGVCTVAGTTVTIVGGGLCTINADQPGNALYAAASQVQQSFTVAPASQTITFTQPTAPATATTSATLVFSSSSSLPVTITPSDATVCSVVGTTLNYLKSGTCALTATQAGSADYNSATPVLRNVTVNTAAQTITFNQPTTPANAGTSATLVATSTSGLAVVFTTTSAASICTISGTTVNYLGAGPCVINANQAGNAVYGPAGQVQRTVAVNAPDGTAPGITSIEPGTESGGWNAIACSTGSNTGRICVTATDNVAVSTVSVTLTKSNGRCWSGTGSGSFDGANCGSDISLTLSGGIWISNQLVRQGGNGQPNFTNDTYTLVVTVKDAAGNTTTATRTFTVTGT